MNPIAHAKALLVLLFAALVLTGCPGFGEVKVPEQGGKPVLSKSEQLLTDAYVKLAAAYRTVGQMEARKRITAAEKARYDERLGAIRRDLNFARAATGSNQESQVQLALNLLLVLEAELQAKEAGK